MTPKRRALYIDGHSATRVLRDGPALRIRMPQRADFLIPLRRVCRVVVMGVVPWSSQALCGCIDALIPVSFLTRDGRWQGSLLAPDAVTRTHGIVSALDTYCSAFGWAADDHRSWVAEMVDYAQWRYVRGSCRPVYGVKGAFSMSITDHEGKHYARSRHLRQFDRRLLGFLKAHLLYLFRREASPLPWLPILQTLGLNLVNDYASILFWTLQRSKRRFLKRAYVRARRHGCAKADIPVKAASEFYESQSVSVEIRFRRLLRHHHAQLREALGCHADDEKTPIFDML